MYRVVIVNDENIISAAKNFPIRSSVNLLPNVVNAV